MNEAIYQFIRIGLLVTGDGETKYLPQFFKAISAYQATDGSYSQIHFEVIAKVKQLSPKQNLKKQSRFKGVPTLEEEIGLHARRYLHAHQSQPCYVLLIDDLEYARVTNADESLARYQSCFMLLPDSTRWKAAVFFLVMMLEAYFWADIEATNEALGLSLPVFRDDVEGIRHPNEDLDNALRSQFDNSRKYHEIEDGHAIVRKLDLNIILGNPDTCRALRSLITWCWCAANRPLVQQFQLISGGRDNRTAGQIESLRISLVDERNSLQK